MTNGRRVYVQTLQYLGVAEVLRVKRGDRLLVETPTGRTHTVRASDCRDLAPQSRSSQPLETPANAPELEGGDAYPKAPPARMPAYLAWLRTRPCARCGVSVGIEASHHAQSGHGTMGRKPPDARAIPLCTRDHRLYHSDPARFPRDWIDSVIAAHTRAWVRSLGK